jgi:hypothetical protein
MEKTLEFIETFSIAQFKSDNNVDTIEVIQNPKEGGKLFFVAGRIKGPVSPNYKESPVVSLVQGENEEQFYLLHKRSTANVVDVL